MQYKNKTMLTRALMLSVCLSLSGCGPKKPTITPQQIDQAQQNGTLNELYEKVQLELQQASGSRRETLNGISAQIADRIALKLQQQIYQQVEDERLPEGVAPLERLQQLKQQTEQIKRWSESRYSETRKKMTNEATQTQDVLSQKLLAVSKIPASDQVKRIAAMEKAARIAGENSRHYQNFVNQKQQTIDNWLAQVDQATAKREYAVAQTYLRKVIGLEPKNEQAKKRLASLQQQEFSSVFRQSLEKGQPEKAYEAFMSIAQTPMFESVKASLGNSIKLLVRFFENQGLQASSKGALKGAYKSFTKARNIQQLIGEPLGSEAEFHFLRKMVNLAANRGKEKRYGEQLAYLEIVAGFNPEYPGIQTQLHKTREFLVKYSSTVLKVEDFSQTGTHHSAGKSVAQKVYGWVFDNMKGDIALVQQHSDSVDADAPGRLLVLQGDILEAGVESDNSSGQKTMRVVTETQRQPNPAYAKWLKDGKDGAAPDEFNILEKKEDITVNTQYLRKTGILSIAYRLAETNGQVVVNENARDKKLFEGEGNESVSIGEFTLERKRAELPSDIEIMEQLSVEVATQIGAKLSEMLKDPDIRYQAAAERLLAENQLEAGKDYLAYALAIRQAKQGETAEIRKQLIETVMQE
ncbi:hypothetical protein [Pleionea sp. CnH1-48]|uniref:hypothetical protein n=1 Tax=Pleionea sp. CnH1-48 TaxID=2954494 RepID=UPI002097EEDC|nr:hypothetical protein [Pleionea sp. CnH1-48]MCO7223694.1 hypothetical protein [Pleionea sp. CnH1-48]